MSAQDVALAQDRGKITCEAFSAEFLRLDSHVRETRMHSQFSEDAAVRGDAPRCVDGFELLQQLARLGKRCRGRRVEPGEAVGIRRAPAGQFQRERRKICVQNFRRRLRVQGGMRAFRPKPVTISRAQTAGASPTLIRCCLRHFSRHQPTHSRGGIEFGIAPKTSVNNDANAFNGEAGLGNAGGEHDFALARRRRRECRILFGTFKLTVQRHDSNTAIEIRFLQRALHAADFRGAGQEAENVSGMITNRRAHHLCHLQLKVNVIAPWHIVRRYFKAASLCRYDRCVAEQPHEGFQIERG